MNNEIKSIPFNQNEIKSVRELKYGENWPVVYILSGKKEAYIGETSSVYNRLKQHKTNKVRKNLNEVKIIYDSEFNKSAIQDIESLLINYMVADQKYVLQNLNAGINRSKSYFDRKKYLEKFDSIWDELHELGLVIHDKQHLENQDLFKFSPYKTLNEDQFKIANEIVKEIIFQKDKSGKTTFLINGAPGTGKSVLAVYLMKMLIDTTVDINYKIDEIEELNYLSILTLLTHYSGNMKIGLVIPMTSLRKTLKKVFVKTKGLYAKMVMSPSEATNNVIKTSEKYDVLIVDEAHRLRRRVNLQPGQYVTFDKINKHLDLFEGDELDWIVRSSKNQILFYDENQSIKPSDIRKDKVEEYLKYGNVIEYTLATQMRINGGAEYITYIYNVLDLEQDKKKTTFREYEFKLFDNVNDMYDLIRKKDDECGLSRMVAGYAWKWNTKDIDYETINSNNICDINIGEYHYIWNHTNEDWVNSKNAINEIGCIHTVQGYDLNYVGVIIGPELKYDKLTKKIIVDKSLYFDSKGKDSVKTEKELKDYILNIYKVLMTRGIMGTYVYACNPELNEYLKKFISIK